MNSKELKKYFNDELELIRIELGLKKVNGWKSEIFNKISLSSTALSKSIAKEDKSLIDKYLYMIAVNSVSLSPVEVIRADRELKKLREDNKELDKLKRDISLLVVEAGKEEHY